MWSERQKKDVLPNRPELSEEIKQLLCGYVVAEEKRKYQLSAIELQRGER